MSVIPSRQLNMLLCVLLSLCPSLALESRHLLNVAIRVSRQIYIHNLPQIDTFTAIQYIQTLIAYSPLYPDMIESLVNHTLHQRASLTAASPQRQSSTKGWIRYHLIGSIVNNVLYADALNSLASAIKEDSIDENWMRAQCECIADVATSNEQRQILGMLILLTTILAEPPDSYFTSNANDANRPEHNQVLDYIIQICDFGQLHLKSSEGAILVLRRILIPTAIEACITGSYRQSHFQRLLRLFISLFRNYASELKAELGAWLHSVLLDFLECRSTSHLQKWDILEAIEILLNSAQQVIDIFVNFDGGLEPLPVYERLIVILSDICNEQAVPVRPAELLRTSSSSAISTVNPELLHLKKYAISMLVNLLEMQSRWLSSHLIINNVYQASATPPVAKSDGSVVAKSLSPRGSPRANRPSAAKLSISPISQRSSFLSPISADPAPHRKRSSWREQMVSRDAHHQAIQKALSLAAGSSLSAAIRYLVLVEHSNRRRAVRGIQWRPVAVFLYRTRSLNQEEVGDLLSSQSDETFSEQDFNELRTAFTDLLDFTNRPFESSLRSFVNDSGFWMPESKEGSERLLRAFCEAYCRDNKDTFKSIDDAFRLAKASYSLSTGDVVECKEWVQLLDHGTFNEGQMRELYSSLISAPLICRQERLSHRKTENDNVKKETLLLEQTESSVHNALAIIRNCSKFKNRYSLGTTSVSIASFMFDDSWVQFLGCLSSPVISSFADSGLILNGLMHGTICALLLAKIQEKESFLSILARYVYLRSTKDAPEQQKVALLSGVYMSQDWIAEFNSLPVSQACDLLIDVVHNVRNCINFGAPEVRVTIRAKSNRRFVRWASKKLRSFSKFCRRRSK